MTRPDPHDDAHRPAPDRNRPSAELAIPALLKQPPEQALGNPAVQKARMSWESIHHDMDGEPSESTCYWTLPVYGNAVHASTHELTYQTRARLADGPDPRSGELHRWTSIGWMLVARLQARDLEHARSLAEIHQATLQVAARLWIP